MRSVHYSVCLLNPEVNGLGMPIKSKSKLETYQSPMRDRNDTGRAQVFNYCPMLLRYIFLNTIF